MTKPKRKGPEYSREREFKVILEDLQSQFRTFGEGLEDVREQGERLEADVSQIKEDVGQLKAQMTFIYKVIPTVATKDDLRQFEKRLTALEAAR